MFDLVRFFIVHPLLIKILESRWLSTMAYRRRFRVTALLAVAVAMTLPAPFVRSEDMFELSAEELEEDLDGEVEMPQGESVRVIRRAAPRPEDVARSQMDGVKSMQQ